MTTDRRRVIVGLGALFVGGGALSACETTDASRVFPTLDFSGNRPITLAVAEIAVENAYRMPFQDPNVEHRAPLSPSAAVERWAQDVLKPGGTSGRAIVRIINGSLIETPLTGSTGLTGLITTDQSERYDAAVSAKIEIYDQFGAPVGAAEAEATRFQTVPEDIPRRP